MRRALLLLALGLVACEREEQTPSANAPHVATSGVVECNGSNSDCKSKIDAAASGTTIMIPATNASWDTPVTIKSGVKVLGAGAGRIIGKTKPNPALSVGTGSKTFTNVLINEPFNIVVGETLLVAKYPKRNGSAPARENWMKGTVTSFSGTTLNMNITESGGSGTYQFYWIARPPVTIIQNNYNNGCNQNNGCTPLFKLQSGAEIGGIQIVNKSGSYSSSVGVDISGWIAPKALIHDMWFELGENDSSGIFTNSNQVLVWNCSFDSNRWTSNVEGIQIVNNDSQSPSWRTPSTMGAADTNCATNFYVEDSDFHALLTARDPDNNSRYVERYNVFDNCSGGPHGADTSTIGARHWESVHNKFQFDAFSGSDCSPEQDVQWYWWGRGGTGVIAYNDLPSISSSCGGNNRPNIRFSVMNIQYVTGPYCCWKDYPAPHQVGQGYVGNPTLVSYTGQRCYVGQRYDYYISAEPVYIFRNTGTAGNRVNLADMSDDCGNGQKVVDWVKEGRDYIVADKPGYSEPPYPNPLRSGPMPTPEPTTPTSPSPSATATSTATATATSTIAPSPSPTVSPTVEPSVSPTPTEAPSKTITIKPGQSILIVAPTPKP